MATSVQATAERSAISYPSRYPSQNSSSYPPLPPMPGQHQQTYYNAYPSPPLAPVHKFSHIEHDPQAHVPSLIPHTNDNPTYSLSTQLPPPDSVYPPLHPPRDTLPTVYYDPIHTIDQQQQQPIEVIPSDTYPHLHPPPQISHHHDGTRQLDHQFRAHNDQLGMQSMSSTARSLTPSQSVLHPPMYPSTHTKEISPSPSRFLYVSSSDASNLINVNANSVPVTMLTSSVPTYHQQLDQAHPQHMIAPAHLPPPTHFSPVLSATVPAQLPHPMISVPRLQLSTQSQYDPSALSTHQLGGHIAVAQDPLATQQSYVAVQQQPNTVLLGHVQPAMNHSAMAQPTLTPTPEMLIPQPLVQQNAPSSAVVSGHEVMGNCQNSSLTPEACESYLAVCRACRDLGRYDLATDAYRAYNALCPDAYNPTGYPNEYNYNMDCGQVYSEIFNNIGNALTAMGRNGEAEIAYRAALNVSPCHAHAWNNLGNLLRAKGAVVEAMSCFSAALSTQPGYASAHSKLAGLLRDQGKPQEAESQYRAALMSDPHLTEAAAGLGTALRDMGRTEEAVAFYDRAVNLQPNCADHHANLANTYKDLNRIEESIVSYQAALTLRPDLPDAFCNMVHSLSVICDWRNRSQNFVTLLAIIDRQLGTLLHHPNTNPRLYNILLGALSSDSQAPVKTATSRAISTSTREDSTDFLRHRRFIHHPSSPTVVKKAELKGKMTKFSTNNPSVVAPVLASGLPSVQPFHALIYPMSPEKFRALSAAYAARAESMVAGIPHVTQRWVAPRGQRARLKVGYVSSDYNNHPYSHLTQSIYGYHRNGGIVECYCYALTPSDNSAWRYRIERESEHFRDISGMNAKQSAEAIAADGIHVLINCNGYTKGARTELFALRPAPVQVSFMGFPGTLGAHYIEYFITDVVTSPPELASRMHSEALLYHPHSYFVNDHLKTSIPGPAAHPNGPLTRARYGLPENCFLFIMHNQLYKLSPDTFDVWARILKRVPGSKIWLLRFPASGEQRIRQEAAARGLSEDRLIFTDVAGKEEHVARAGLGDLFLDTPTCNAHTTGTDVLWSGVPMITCPGSLFASRVAASLLTAAGLSELIASDMNEYEDLAVALATNRPRLAAIRAKIEVTRYSNALFDTERWVRNVEALYWRAWRNYDAGNKPTHIFGQDVYDGSTMVQKPATVESMYSGSDSHRSETLMFGKMYSSVLAT